MGSVPFALCSILYTKPFGDSLGLKEKISEFFFRLPPLRLQDDAPADRLGDHRSGPLCSLLYAYILNLLGILGVSRKKFQNFFSDSRLSAFRTMRRRTDSAITGRVPSGVGSPLLSALCLYIKPFGDSGGLKRKNLRIFSDLARKTHRALPMGASEHPHGDVDRMPLRKAHPVRLQVFQELSVYLLSRARMELVAVRHA